ncbi:MAG: DNA modification methyltransferase [uncultured Solirubrobacteraceae bacterium]|uniref:DNA modification methyltransferase n=1 Tax=uncultured Solirubrobacteraceae bacterium TaxID=1162706 RepID=A0A6J4S4N6_9ACTN|nr:MAG: DNA modification methyltransferase [uncultured Solirubrobacteraceae bacterium]
MTSFAPGRPDRALIYVHAVKLIPANETPTRLGDEDLVIHGENSAVLPRLPSGAFDLVYIDPPFNTGIERRLRSQRMVRDPDGDRLGFGGRRYSTRVVTELAYGDPVHGDYLAFLAPRLEQARRVLAAHGTLYLHLDYREAHYAKVLLDDLFGRDAFLNEIVWAYDYGGRSRRRWPAKHDTILVYARTPGEHHFDSAEVDREPYMAPGLVGPDKAARGKLPTDCWWHTIVPTSGAERTGYPTQKPEGILRRIVAASSRPGGRCLDFFAGSGTLGAACRSLDRRFVLVDESAEAIGVILRRLGEPVPASP